MFAYLLLHHSDEDLHGIHLRSVRRHCDDPELQLLEIPHRCLGHMLSGVVEDQQNLLVPFNFTYFIPFKIISEKFLKVISSEGLILNPQAFSLLLTHRNAAMECSFPLVEADHYGCIDRAP